MNQTEQIRFNAVGVTEIKVEIVPLKNQPIAIQTLKIF